MWISSSLDHRCFQLVRPDAEPISSRRNSVKKHVMGCGLTALFLSGNDSPIGCFSARNPFLAEPDCLITLASRRNYQLRQNGAVDITLFKRCITSICNTYLYGHIAQPKQSTPVKISRSQQLRIHDGKYQVGHNVPPDIRGFLSISPPTHNIHPQMAP